MEEQGLNNQVTKKTLNTAIFKHKKTMKHIQLLQCLL